MSHSHCSSCHAHEHGHVHDHHNAGGTGPGGLRAYVPPAVSFLLLLAGLVFDGAGAAPFSVGWVRLLWYVAAFLPVGWPVAREAFGEMRHGDVFSEFTLMLLASFGAFYIGEYPEAVAVMLFYAVGERFQDRAVARARRSISALVEMKPASVAVWRGGERRMVAPEDVRPGEVVEVPAGGRLPLDGRLLDEAADFDTAALTGESEPRAVDVGGSVSAGMIALGRAVRVKVERPYADSALARILRMVEEASERKAPAELFIRRFARIYTPVVMGLALAIVVLPALYGLLIDREFDYVFASWLYRGLVFLVISCPCALVVSVPLSYFSGIGVASRRGILFKGGNYLDVAARVNTVVFDKTGTLTRGQFEVEGVAPAAGVAAADLLSAAAAAESASTHPVARAVVRAAEAAGCRPARPARVDELPGRGIRALVGGREVLAGNLRLLAESGVNTSEVVGSDNMTQVFCAVDGRYAGSITLDDAPRDDASAAVRALHALGVGDVCILSGDKEPVVARLAGRLGIGRWRGGLLPEGKVACVERLAADPSRVVAFVGDGVNDAPVLAMSHLGVAMGGAGSDAAVETADVVVQSDRPSKLAEAIRIGRATVCVARANIALAIGVKLLVMLLGVLGMAGLWQAVLADTGVALLCVANVFSIGRVARLSVKCRTFTAGRGAAVASRAA